MGQKFAIFILLWISLTGTFNLESNEVLSDVLVFYFLAHLTQRVEKREITPK
jgi:hypothetical protein